MGYSDIPDDLGASEEGLTFKLLFYSFIFHIDALVWPLCLYRVFHRLTHYHSFPINTQAVV
jgi:hypothetical protein